MKELLVILILFSSILFAENISFKEKLSNASKGDFIIYEYNKIYSALSVYDIDENNIILEEITISKDKFDRRKSFRSWIETGAESNTSWTLYKIDLKKNKIIDAFSISRNCFVKLANSESFLTKLLELSFDKLRDNERKKIGPIPNFGEVDRRALWNPTKIVDAKKIKKPIFDAYRSIWPEDNSEFSSKIFEIYFDKTFAFPFFIEVSTGHISYMIKAIDSGKFLNSKISYFPKRYPEIVNTKIETNNLVLTLNNADHFESFNLFAIDFSMNDRIVHPMRFQMKKNEDLVFLEIDLQLLNELFEKNHKYRFIASPKFQKNIYIENKNLFIWK